MPENPSRNIFCTVRCCKAMAGIQKSIARLQDDCNGRPAFGGGPSHAGVFCKSYRFSPSGADNVNSETFIFFDTLARPAMSFSCNCPTCRQVLQTHEPVPIGRSVKCPACGNVFIPPPAPLE